jgi:hypothetical protein
MADMSSFRQAREVVQQKLGETLADGYEDELDYNVLLADPATDDQVNLVSKRTGKSPRTVLRPGGTAQRHDPRPRRLDFQGGSPPGLRVA